LSVNVLNLSPANPTSSSNSQSSTPFNPKVGDHVLARWGNETYEQATIKAIEGDRATVLFDGAAKEDEVKFPSQIMAIPTAPVKVAAGDYVLAQYPFQKQMWIGGRVNSVGGANRQREIQQHQRRLGRAGEHVGEGA